jgi:hypothetical protein
MNNVEHEHGAPEWPVDVVATLDDFQRQHETAQGIAISDLAAGAVLVVRTRHSCYRLTIVNPASRLALVRGGSVYPEETSVRVEGSTVGGVMLRQGWIGIGFRLELSGSAGRVLTSAVTSMHRAFLAPDRDEPPVSMS